MTRRGGAAVVLLYHRVILTARDPFWIRVTPEHFAEHLDVLARSADVVPLTAIREPTGRHRVAITFDDGYADNLEIARPLLEQAGMPAAVFVASDGLTSTDDFWWDRLDDLLPDTDATPARSPLELDLGHGRVLVDVRTRAARERALQLIQRRVATRPLTEIAPVLDQLADQLGEAPGPCPSHRRMTAAQVRDLVRGDLIDVGGHTRSHPMLSALSPAEQWAEIAGGKETLETALGRPVTTFAYPFGVVGSSSMVTTRLVRKAGFDLACTTEFARVTRWTSRYRIPRLTVPDCDGDEFAGLLTDTLNGGDPSAWIRW